MCIGIQNVVSKTLTGATAEVYFTYFPILFVLKVTVFTLLFHFVLALKDHFITLYNYLF